MSAEHSQETLKEYSLVYQYQIATECSDESYVADNLIVSEERSLGEEHSEQKKRARDLIFHPRKYLKNNDICQKINSNEENTDSVDASLNKNDQKHGKNILMPVKCAIFLLKKRKLISNEIFLEIRRSEKILQRRLNLRRNLRNSTETLDLSGILKSLSQCQYLCGVEVNNFF